jgi:hypothetical protein
LREIEAAQAGQIEFESAWHRTMIVGRASGRRQPGASPGLQGMFDNVIELCFVLMFVSFLFRSASAEAKR